MPLRKSLSWRLELGQLMSPNIHKSSEPEPIKGTPSEPKDLGHFWCHKIVMS